VFVTHDQEEALEIADEVVIMNQARVQQVGTPQEVYDHPATPFVYEFLGNVNRFQLPSRGFAHAEAFEVNGGRFAYVRPHDIELLPLQDGIDGELARVQAVHTAGSVARVTCTRNHARDEPVEAEISRQRLAELGLQIGDSVLLRMRRGRVFEDFTI
jgi:sulfate transport system ATP-binding protein